jgi:hypothetical protein
MGVSLKPEHLKRYKDFAWLLFKYGRGDLVRHAGLSQLMPEEPAQTGKPPAEAEELAASRPRSGSSATPGLRSCCFSPRRQAASRSPSASW